MPETKIGMNEFTLSIWYTLYVSSEAFITSFNTHSYFLYLHITYLLQKRIDVTEYFKRTLVNRFHVILPYNFWYSL